MTWIKTLFEGYLNFNYGIACFVFGVVLCGYLYVIQKRNDVHRKSISRKELLYGLLLSIYLVLLFGGTLLNRTIGRVSDARLELFWSYRMIINKHDVGMVKDIIFNILAFVPWAVLFANISKKMQEFKLNVGSAVLVSIVIETIQFLFKCGLFEFDDIFHNTLGAIIGYMLWKGVTFSKGKSVKTEDTNDFITLGGNVCSTEKLY